MLTYTFGLKVELRPESDAHDIAESIEHYLNFNGIHAIHKEYEDSSVVFTIPYSQHMLSHVAESIESADFIYGKTEIIVYGIPMDFFQP